MAQKRLSRIQTIWPCILDAMSISSFQKQWVQWPEAKTKQDILNLSREVTWLVWTGHVPTPSAYQISEYSSVLSFLQGQTAPRRREVQLNWWSMSGTGHSSWLGQGPGMPAEDGLCSFSPHQAWFLPSLLVLPDDSLPVDARVESMVHMPEPLTE